ncbi:MAG: hypothetical protein AAB130_03850 [Nitrospirota bacterium]
MPEVEFICLANSIKKGGRCIAGLRTNGEGWVRPVNPLTGSLYSHQYVLDNGRDIELLDIVKVSLQEPCPQPYQPENWTLNNQPWHFVRQLSHSEAKSTIESIIVSGPDLLGNQFDSVPQYSLEQNPVKASLALIEPGELKWRITTNRYDRLQARACFTFGGCNYDLSITDPVWKERLTTSLPIGFHVVSDADLPRRERLYFTISLGAPYRGSCYKLVAAVIVLPTA